MAPVAPRRSDVPELPEQRLQRLGQRQEHLHERDDHRGSCSAELRALARIQRHGALGLPNFDEMAYWTDQRLADYIHAGMGGEVARPEITGGNLCDLIFYIRMKSVRAMREELSRGVCSLP